MKIHGRYLSLISSGVSGEERLNTSSLFKLKNEKDERIKDFLQYYFNRDPSQFSLGSPYSGCPRNSWMVCSYSTGCINTRIYHNLG
jgi:hypothetical protein